MIKFSNLLDSLLLNSSKKKNNSKNNHVKNNFELASNGLEHKVIKKYEMDYYNGDITSSTE